jgi:hypothetical protein
MREVEGQPGNLPSGRKIDFPTVRKIESQKVALEVVDLRRAHQLAHLPTVLAALGSVRN